MCNCTVIESLGMLIIKAERWSSVISLYILLWHVAKIVLPPIGLLHEIDFITPGSEALPAPGLGDDVTAAKCKLTCPGLSQTYGQGWGFPLENGQGPSNATTVHPVLRDR